MSNAAWRLIRIGLALAWLAGMPAWSSADSTLTVNDVSQLNEIPVQNILVPTTIDEIVAAVTSHAGPISIGGGRYSMGGQTATEGAIQIDMRAFDEVVNFAPERLEITVQTGITWRKIQDTIDSYDLSLTIMQTYANFTVGGSLSVNVHGRYMGHGPLVTSVTMLRVVLASGELVNASPDTNPEIYFGVIGGYGALGVIVEATLSLTRNTKVARESVVMPLGEYRAHFMRTIRGNPDVIFHNADIYPGAYTTVRSTSHFKSAKALTVQDRLVDPNRDYPLERFGIWVVSEWPFGKAIRQHLIDPLYYWRERVVWRNYEASYDARELEPRSREKATYALQEYFVPVEEFDHFVPRLTSILKRHDVNIINISIRHATPDPGTYLAWARAEVFAFVLYYKQGVTEVDKQDVGVWTRELINAALTVGGTYYLPYQIHATKAQFHAGYPRADEFFALKHRLDPTNKFRNKLWDVYYAPPTPDTSPAKINNRKPSLSRHEYTASE